MEDVKIVVERRYAPDPIDYERLVSLVESTGERVVLTDAEVPVSVLLPAGVVAELEHWARTDHPAPAPVAEEGEEADWLADQAKYRRQGFMDPKQAAFEEFLARQPPVGEQ
ncbi:hypothetical protein [Streptomyces chrestomyceticus]|uniref:hypothetical protein n=1 Tax=Streptomyces chrestomyceticus TaxID=68185 RepID=UPI00379F5F7A